MAVPGGWSVIKTVPFATLVGPFYRPTANTELARQSPQICGFVAEERHGNKRGVVQGGMLATAFDVGLGDAAWEATEQRPCATVHMAIQYLGAVRIGDFVIIEPEVVKATRSMVFVRGLMRVERDIVATAEWIGKILERRGEPSATVSA